MSSESNTCLKSKFGPSYANIGNLMGVDFSPLVKKVQKWPFWPKMQFFEIFKKIKSPKNSKKLNL